MSWQCSGLARESYAWGNLKLVPRRRDGLINEYIAMIYFCQNLFELEKKKNTHTCDKGKTCSETAS